MASRVDELLCGNPIISHSNSPIGATLRSSAIIASGYQLRRRGAQWCTRGAQCAQWYPNGTHGDPRGPQRRPVGFPWRPMGSHLRWKGSPYRTPGGQGPGLRAPSRFLAPSRFPRVPVRDPSGTIPGPPRELPRGAPGREKYRIH